MSWEGGERPRRRWAAPAVIVGCLAAVLVVGILVRQERPGPALTVETAAPERARPAPSPENPPTVRSRRSEAQPSEALPVPERRQLAPLPEVQGVLWATSYDGVLARLDLAGGELVEARVQDFEAEQRALVPVTGAGVVHVALDPRAGSTPTARLYTTPDAPPVELGEAEYAVASATPGRVWLIGPGGSGTGLVPLREVAADGTVTVEAALPPSVHVLEGVAGGVLVDAAGTLVVYDPVAGEGARVGDGQLIAASAQRLARWACDEALRCWIGVGPFDDPDGVRLPEEPVLLGYGGALTADGSRLAVLSQGDGTADHRPVVHVLGVPSGYLLRMPSPERFDGWQGEIAWHPSGRWLFVPTRAGVTVWDVQTGQIVPLDLGLGDIAAIAVQ